MTGSLPRFTLRGHSVSFRETRVRGRKSSGKATGTGAGVAGATKTVQQRAALGPVPSTGP